MIERTELLELLTDDAKPLWLIEAGAGFGKTVLINQIETSGEEELLVLRRPRLAADAPALVLELSRASRRAGRTETSEALAGCGADPGAIADLMSAEHLGLALDDVQDWEDEVGPLVLEIVAAGQGEIRTIVAGRHLPPTLAALRERPEWNRLGNHNLAFTRTEIESELAAHGLGEPALVSLVDQLCQGWPLAVASAAARMEASNDPMSIARELGQHQNLVDGLLRSHLAALAASDRSVARSLAAMPFFDEEIARLLADDALLDRLEAGGITLNRRPDGWSEIAPQFRTALTRASNDPVKVPSAAIDHLVGRSEVQAAIDVSLSLGDLNRAASIIAGLSLTEEATLDAAELNAAMTAIGAGAEAAPRCLTVQARVNATFGRVAEAISCLETSQEICQRLDPNVKDDVHVETLLELGLAHAMEGDFAQAKEVASRARPAVGNDSAPHLQARLHDLSGLLLLSEGTDEHLEQAAHEMTAALSLWRQLDEPRQISESACRLAGDVLVCLGRRHEGLELLDTVAQLDSLSLMNRARVGIDRAALLPYVGRSDEVLSTTVEPRRIAQLLGHKWLTAWAIWVELIAASFMGDGPQVQRLMRTFVEGEYLVSNMFTQGLMWCETSEALARCELFDGAREALGRAQAIEGLPDWYVQYYEASIEARDGNADAAIKALGELAKRSDVEREKRWAIDLLRAYAYWRLGDDDGRQNFESQAFDEAASLGQPTLPTIVEKRLVAALQAQAPEPSLASAGTRVCVFGPFRVVISGQPAQLAGGLPANLVKVLALGDGRLILDQVIDRLWPDADLKIGRRRLRNVLRRVREACGDLVLRSGETLHFADHVTTDLLLARTAAKAALAPEATLTEVSAAVAQNREPLLPDDRYVEWAEQARVEQEQQLVQLLDRQAKLAEVADDIDLAVTALTEAAGIDPFGQYRIMRAAELLDGVGRSQAADALRPRSGDLG